MAARSEHMGAMRVQVTVGGARFPPGRRPATAAWRNKRSVIGNFFH
jgi:hypothetical protein